MDFPRELDLMEAFGNSFDLESGRDDLKSAEGFGQWLAANGFPQVDGHPSAAELELALALRAALRDELIARHDGDEGGLSQARLRLDELAARVPLRASFGTGTGAFVSVEGGAAVMLGEVLTAMVVAQRDGSWRRIKVCHEDTCRWVFHDRSKNGSKTWCSMEVCGNRNKTRSYRQRQR